MVFCSCIFGVPFVFEMKKLCVWFWKACFGSSEEKNGKKSCLWTTTFSLSSMETPLRKSLSLEKSTFSPWCSFVNAFFFFFFFCQWRGVLHFVPVYYWNWTSRLAKNWDKKQFVCNLSLNIDGILVTCGKIRKISVSWVCLKFSLRPVLISRWAKFQVYLIGKSATF